MERYGEAGRGGRGQACKVTACLVRAGRGGRGGVWQAVVRSGTDGRGMAVMERRVSVWRG